MLKHGTYIGMPNSGSTALEQAVASGMPMWDQLKAAHPLEGMQMTPTTGAAGHFEVDARQEAAGRLMMNHEAVLRDICNPSPTTNVTGKALTQNDLVRVPPEAAVYVDGMLRELVRRLLGASAGGERLDPSNTAQQQSWNMAAMCAHPSTSSTHPARLTS